MPDPTRNQLIALAMILACGVALYAIEQGAL